MKYIAYKITFTTCILSACFIGWVTMVTVTLTSVQTRGEQNVYGQLGL